MEACLYINGEIPECYTSNCSEICSFEHVITAIIHLINTAFVRISGQKDVSDKIVIVNETAKKITTELQLIDLEHREGILNAIEAGLDRTSREGMIKRSVISEAKKKSLNHNDIKPDRLILIVTTVDNLILDIVKSPRESTRKIIDNAFRNLESHEASWALQLLKKRLSTYNNGSHSLLI